MTYRLKDDTDLYLSFVKSHREQTEQTMKMEIPSRKIDNLELGLRKRNWSLNLCI